MGVMNTETIITALLAAAAALKNPAVSVASQALKDLYAATKYYLRRKFQLLPDAAKALEFAVEKPTSAPRKAALLEEAEGAALDQDEELAELVCRLRAALPVMTDASRVAVSVEGTRNQVNVAGRDLTVTSRMVRRNVITPDDRHLAREQRSRLRTLIHDLAARLGGTGSEPNLPVVHAMLQRRFDVPSYLLIPRERYPEALAYLQHELVIRRSILRRRDPGKFRQELFRSIYARAGELGWSREKFYRFAAEGLAVPSTVTSLKQLTPDQLRSLADRLRRMPATATLTECPHFSDRSRASETHTVSGPGPL